MEAKALKSAAKEFNTVILLDTPVVVKNNENLEADLYKALEYIEPEDKFTAETQAVFAELRAKYDVKKDKKADKKAEATKEVETKKEKKVIVKAGDVVEIDPHTNKIKKEEKEMKSEKSADKPKKEKEEKPEVRIIRIILDRKVNKEALETLLKEEEVFTSLDKKARKELKNETNFMSLKKKMLDVFDQDLVKELRAELPPIDKTPKDFKPEKDSALVKGIKEAKKVKELKSIAKANEQFSWKKLKKLEDFEEIQEAMLKVAGGGKVKSEKKAEPAKPKMVPNPLIAEINAFGKVKKLAKWCKTTDAFDFSGVKKPKEYADVELLKAALIKSLTVAGVAEVEVKAGKAAGGATHEKRESNWDERKPFVVELIKEAAYTRAELMAKLVKKFPGQDKSHSNMLSEIKNPKYATKYGLGKLVEENKDGHYRFVKK